MVPSKDSSGFEEYIKKGKRHRDGRKKLDSSMDLIGNQKFVKPWNIALEGGIPYFTSIIVLLYSYGV